MPPAIILHSRIIAEVLVEPGFVNGGRPGFRSVGGWKKEAGGIGE
jgi:hypothetical protein